MPPGSRWWLALRPIATRTADTGGGLSRTSVLRRSQPGAALHAFEAIAFAGPHSSPRSRELLEWLAKVSLADGGLPFALPLADPVASAPFWASADPSASSLQITAAVAAQAHRAARWDDVIRTHPWLDRATRYCFDQISRIDEPPFAYVMSFSLQLLDVAAETYEEAGDLLGHLMQFVPVDGALPVVGGAEGETVHISSEPGLPLHELLGPEVLKNRLDQLARDQLPDGGWPVDFTSYSEAAKLEWRGYMTAQAVATLRMNGRV